MTEPVPKTLGTMSTTQNNHKSTAPAATTGDPDPAGDLTDFKKTAEPSETDILYKYQQAHERRLKNGQNNQHKPTKRQYGERRDSMSGSHNPSCLKESFYILFTWLCYFIHITIFVVPNGWWNGKITVKDFYDDYAIDIAPANWNMVQLMCILLWQGILLTYLSLIIAEHTIKIFDKRFYFASGLAHIGVGIWDISTEHKSYLGRTLSWLATAVCLVYANYILLKHIYCIYDVTKYALAPFRLDSMPSEHNDNVQNIDILNTSDQKQKSDEIAPLSNNESRTARSRNMNAILRIQSGQSMNNSPNSMSMAPSAAQKLVYDAAMAANQAGEDWLVTKTTDLTLLKYAGLVGIVFNGTSYFLSLVMIDFWVQIGVWLVYSCDVRDSIASIVALMMMFGSILIYYYLDFCYFKKYLIDNFATHIVFCVTFAAMVWKHVFGDCKNNGKTHSFSVVIQMVIFGMVVIVGVFKIIVAITIHRKYKKESSTENNDQYKRVI